MKRSLFITQSAVIAALYVALTLVSNAFGLANGAIQFRISEALTVLPAFMPAAVPGLVIGCLISNLLTDGVLANILGGTFATLIGAIGTRLLKKHTALVSLPPILANTLIVPFIIMYAYGAPGTYGYFALTVFIGEAVVAGVFGTAFAYTLKKRPELFD